MSPKINLRALGQRAMMSPKINQCTLDETTCSDVTATSTAYDTDSNRSSCDTHETHGTRRVQFHDEIVVHKETMVMSEEEFQAYYLQVQDFERFNMDVKETTMKWLQHLAERAAFDEERFTIRGLEAFMDHLMHLSCKKKTCTGRKDQHCKAVLKEYRRQTGAVSSRYMEEKVRAMSERFSAAAVKQAIKLGKTDALHEKASSSQGANVPTSRLDDAHFNVRRLPVPVKTVDSPELDRSIERNKQRGLLSFMKKKSSRSVPNPDEEIHWC